MKKHLAKILAVSLGAVSLIFVVMLIIFLFSENPSLHANNLGLQIVFIIFSLVFGAGTFLSIYFSFSDKTRVNSVLIKKCGTSGEAKANIACVKKLAKEAIQNVYGASLKSITLHADEDENVTFRAKLVIAKQKDGLQELDKPSVILDKATAALELEFKTVLELEFKDIKLILCGASGYAAPTKEQIDSHIMPIVVPAPQAVPIVQEQIAQEPSVALESEPELNSDKISEQINKIKQDVEEHWHTPEPENIENEPEQENPAVLVLNDIVSPPQPDEPEVVAEEPIILQPPAAQEQPPAQTAPREQYVSVGYEMPPIVPFSMHEEQVVLSEPLSDTLATVEIPIQDKSKSDGEQFVECIEEKLKQLGELLNNDK